ncbi:MAG: hypothetical protein CMM95_02895 [Rickettsiales bacterium]|nr:hypothetical protein [Candidatus Neomarinimicrobiota bacterium]MBS91981.1 hypothetical protein [Rickettsiales bacterium]|tara:strand:+ start:630 stop:881 length:252 start_codon:yes stop_codon:yes gene_type:complete
MNLGQWLKSLNATDKLILLILYGICIYLSKITLDSLIELYDLKKKNSQFRIRFRITPGLLLGLGLAYSIILHQILGAMFDFIP